MCMHCVFTFLRACPEELISVASCTSIAMFVVWVYI